MFAVTLGFFDDIHIPASCLQHPSRFDEEEQVWIWEYEIAEEKHNLFMDIGSLETLISTPEYLPNVSINFFVSHFVGQKIKFRVMSELFAETSPDMKVNETKMIPENKVPYLLIVSFFSAPLIVL